MRKRPTIRIGTQTFVVLLLMVVAVLLMSCQSRATEAPREVAPVTTALPSDTPIAPAGELTLSPQPTSSLTSIALPTPERPDGATPSPVPAEEASPTVPVTLTVEPLGREPVDSYRIVNVYPHDRTAFTEGLVYVDSILYEGTGLDNQSNPPGQSVLEKKDLETGQVLQGIKLAPDYFGEGVTVLGDRIYQLTWQERTGFVYDKETLQLLDTFSISSDGWGLTHDGERLIRSDGTSTLAFLDPATLEETGRIDVHTPGGNQVVNLNELEYVNGEIYANIWMTDTIVRIDPTTGLVLGWIDLTGLLAPEDRAQRVDVLNGIAYDAAQDRLFVTGKWWPKLFEIDVIPAS